MIKAVYAFSGDPITNGHVNIIKRALDTFGALTVAIGENEKKKDTYTFSLGERYNIAKIVLSPLKDVTVVCFKGLLVKFAYEQNIKVIIRGIRNGEDFNYETMAQYVGRTQKLGIDTHYLVADPSLAHISSGAVKALYHHNGDIHEFVHPYVKQRIESKLSDQFIIGVTGEIASGKSTFCQMATKINRKRFHHIDLDKIAHEILCDRPEPAYKQVRKEIRFRFGKDVMNNGGSVNRKKLGDIVFSNQQELMALNKLLRTPVLVRFREELRKKKGIILAESALLAEVDMAYLCNNNVVLVKTDYIAQRQRLKDRGLNEKQIGMRLTCQYDFEGKMKKISQEILKHTYGTLEVFESNEDSDVKAVDDVISKIYVESA